MRLFARDPNESSFASPGAFSEARWPNQKQPTATAQEPVLQQLVRVVERRNDKLVQVRRCWRRRWLITGIVLAYGAGAPLG